MSHLTLPPLSLYIHIPWCIRKCPYCDFNSHRAGDALPEQAYVERLITDLEEELDAVQGRALHSIFIGGGTPSLFSPQSLAQILNAAERRIGFESDIEITLEANPGTFEQAKFRDFRATGINRLSIGIQSFNDRQLQALGRVHNSDEAQAAFTMARRAGFDNLNLDLMHGLPDQSPEDAAADLRRALAFAPEHLSWYQLTLEPNTHFYSQPPPLPAEDDLADIQDLGQALLAECGYQQYEVSAYSLPGRQSRHNRNYWQFGDYLGIGAGAHGKLTLLDKITRLDQSGREEPGKIVRRWKTRHPNHYLDPDRSLLAGNEAIAVEKLPLEFLMNALRLIDGVDSPLFSQRTGLPLAQLQPQWQQLQAQTLMVSDNRRLQTTPTGQRFLNTVLEAFLRE